MDRYDVGVSIAGCVSVACIIIITFVVYSESKCIKYENDMAVAPAFCGEYFEHRLQCADNRVDLQSCEDVRLQCAGFFTDDVTSAPQFCEGYFERWGAVQP